jgi:hypothetical protein
MGLLTGVNDLVAGFRQPPPISKASVGGVANLYSSLWLANSNAGGTPPTTGGACDNTTAGGIVLPTLTGGQDVYLQSLEAIAGNAGLVVLADRAVAVSGLNGTLTTSQTVTHAALPARFGNGENCEIALEWYTATGATTTNVTINYTDSDNVARVVTVNNIGTSIAASRMIVPQLIGRGVKSVQSVTLSASTATAGNFGITIFRRIASLPLLANTQNFKDFYALGNPALTSSCLFLMVRCSTTSTGLIEGQIGVAVK